MERLNDLSGMSDVKQEDLRRMLMENFRSIERELQGVRKTATTPGVANTEFFIQHDLGLVPSGVHLVGSSAPVRIYSGSTANDNSKVYLKADAANVTITVDISGGEVKS